MISPTRQLGTLSMCYASSFLCIFGSQGTGVGAVFGVYDIWFAVFCPPSNDPLAIPLALLYSDCFNTLIST